MTLNGIGPSWFEDKFQWKMNFHERQLSMENTLMEDNLPRSLIFQVTITTRTPPKSKIREHTENIEIKLCRIGGVYQKESNRLDSKFFWSPKFF